MSGTNTDPENSTVNGYVMLFGAGGMPQAAAMGGPARTWGGAPDLLSLTADNNISGVGEDFSKAVAWIPSATGGNQMIYANLTVLGNISWMIRQEGTNAWVWIGDGTGGNNQWLAASGLSNGTPIGVSFSYRLSDRHLLIYANGAFVSDNATGTTLTAQSYKTSLGGWAAGQNFSGSIVAPSGWNRILSAPEHALWWNSGNPQRLAP